MRKLKDGEIPKTPGDTVVAESADAKAFDPKDFNLELDKVKGSYASWGGGWSNW